MKKKIFAAFAIVSLLATIALGVAVNSADELSVGLPGNYNVQMSTHYVGPTKMRSFSVLTTSQGALAEAEAACPAETVQASQGVIAEAEAGCPAAETVQASQGVIAEAEAGCPAAETVQASQGVIAEAEAACPAAETADALSSLF